MQIKHLQHRHGGRITELTHIRHETHEGKAYWEFVGCVEWDDGSKSEEAHISPVCLCRDPNDKEANDELDAVLGKLNEYLSSNGKWLRDGWKPKSKFHKVALT